MWLDFPSYVLSSVSLVQLQQESCLVSLVRIPSLFISDHPQYLIKFLTPPALLSDQADLSEQESCCVSLASIQHP